MAASEKSVLRPIDPVHVALTLAGARALVGGVTLLSPGRFTGIGPLATPDGRRARAKGARDLALALHQVWTLDRPADLPRTHRLHSLVAVADALSTGLGRSGRLGFASAVVESAAHVLLAKRWENDPQVVAARS